MKKIALFGYYGRNNFGDDLFVYVISRLSERFPSLRCRFVAVSQKKEIVAYGIGAPGLGKFLARNDLLGAAARYACYVSGAIWADHLVFAGGTLFGQQASLRFSQSIYGFSKLLRKPVSAIGVSVGPFFEQKQRDRVLSSLRAFREVAVRDGVSLATLREGGLTNASVSGDIVLALPTIYRPAKTSEQKRTLLIAVHLSEYEETSILIAKHLVQRSLINTISVVSLDEETNASLERLAFNFRGMGVEVITKRYDDSICEIVDLIASAKFVVTSKLHGGITAFAYGVPFVMFAYQRKCLDFLSDNGLPIAKLGPLTSSDVQDLVDASLATQRDEEEVRNLASDSAERLIAHFQQFRT